MKFPDLLSRFRQALVEDGAFHDLTSQLLPRFKNHRTQAQLICHANGVFCGERLIKPLFSILDPHLRVRVFKKDGAPVRSGQMIAKIEGKSQAILSGERVCLNLVCHLSGIATLTHRYVEAVRGTKTAVLDTRKTTPLWRDLEKHAVRCGGGENHRMSLSDAILIKDNHLAYLRQNQQIPSQIYSRARLKEQTLKGVKFVEMEAKTYRDVWEGIKARVDVIMLDNMSLEMIKGSLKLIHAARKGLNTATPLIEISGGITLERARALSKLGIDRISVGALTHSAPALDYSLEVD